MATHRSQQESAGIESRRSDRSVRSMSLSRRFSYFLGTPLVRLAYFLLSASYRVEKTIGAEFAAEMLANGDRVYAPCYWHQQHILCARLIRGWIRRGFRACFLISASLDGDVPTRIARSWGAEVIRGSSSQTGALVLRDMQRMMKRGLSIVTTADGPAGPPFRFKPGAVLMARIGGALLVPLGCAADRAWYLDRWDNFMIPKPFARVVYAIGEPLLVPPDTPLDAIEGYRQRMEDATNDLVRQSKKELLLRGGD